MCRAHTSAALWLSVTVFRSLCAYITALVSCPSGDRVVQTSCCGNLSVEPVCRPSALQRLLVCSVYRPAVLRHDVWQHLSGPSGNLVLSAHKVWCGDCTIYAFRCVCTWLKTRCILFPIQFISNLNFFSTSQRLWMLCHTILSSGSDLRCVLSCSWTAQPMQVLSGRVCGCSEWERHAQVRLYQQLTPFGPLSKCNPAITDFSGHLM